MRDALINAVWKTPSLPTVTPVVTPGVASPIAAVPSLLRCDRLSHDMGGGQVNYGYLHRTASAPKGRLVAVVQGHTTTFDQIGVGDLTRTLVPKGYDVLALGMPGKCGNGGSSDHNVYASMETPSFNPLRYFLEPTVAAINLLAGDYSDVTVTGISGGGWTTVAVAAIDHRVKLSLPVAGSLPWHMRAVNSLGDWEQSRIDQIARYPTLYYLAADAPGRRQVAIHNRYDACCFAQSGNNGSYGTGYQAILDAWLMPHVTTAGGSYAFREDTSHSEHKISSWAIQNVILPELGEPVPFDVTIDDGSAGHTLVGPTGVPNTAGQPGVWTRWSMWGGEAGTGGDIYTAPLGTGNLRSRWSFTVPPGSYTLSASWLRHANRASNAVYRVYDNDVLLGEVAKNQQGTSGLAWGSLGVFAVGTGPLVVELTNEGANGYLVADAVRVQGV